MRKTRNEQIIENFCLGDSPSMIDRQLMLLEGTAHNVICGWWADDKEFRNGGIQTVLGKDWRQKARNHQLGR